MTDTLATTYRRMGFVLGGVLGVIAGAIGGTALLVTRVPAEWVGAGAASLVIAMALAIPVIVLLGFRAHRWTLGDGALEIEERYRLWSWGPARRVSVPYADIGVLQRTEMGAHGLIEVVTRRGRRYRLAEPYVKVDRTISVPDRGRLVAFAAALCERTAQAGGAGEITDGLTFWNRTPGIAFQGVLLAVTLAIAVAAVWSLFTVDDVPVRARFGEAIGILVLLPVGVGFMLRRSLRRRRRVGGR